MDDMGEEKVSNSIVEKRHLTRDEKGLRAKDSNRDAVTAPKRILSRKMGDRSGSRRLLNPRRGMALKDLKRGIEKGRRRRRGWVSSRKKHVTSQGRPGSRPPWSPDKDGRGRVGGIGAFSGPSRFARPSWTG